MNRYITLFVFALLLTVSTQAQKRISYKYNNVSLSDALSQLAKDQTEYDIMFLYNDYYYYKEKSESPNITECIVAKNRHGETATIKLVWDGQYTRFSSPDQSEAPPE